MLMFSIVVVWFCVSQIRREGTGTFWTSLHLWLALQVLITKGSASCLSFTCDSNSGYKIQRWLYISCWFEYCFWFLSCENQRWGSICEFGAWRLWRIRIPETTARVVVVNASKSCCMHRSCMLIMLIMSHCLDSAIRVTRFYCPQEHKTGASSETPYCHCKGSSQDWRYVFRSLQLDERLQPHQLITTIFCFRSSLAAIAQCYLIKDMFVLSSSYTSHQPGFNRACNRRTADS